MNITQRIIISIWIILSITITFLHNPISGYGGTSTTKKSSDIFIPKLKTLSAECTQEALAKWRLINDMDEREKLSSYPTGTEDYNKIYEKIMAYYRFRDHCVVWEDPSVSVTVSEPFYNWYSEDPRVNWLRTMPELLWTQGCLFLAALSALILLRSTKK